MKKIKQYRISWRSTITGNTGHGNWFDETAYLNLKSGVKYANKQFPEIFHWVEERTIAADVTDEITD